nr:unnamed protein product [Spirometra erinaceieuropaei]
MQDSWMVRKDEEMQAYIDGHDSKNSFAAIKAIYGFPTKRTAPIFNSNESTLLMEKSQILKRWAEHFRSVLNCPSTIADAPTTGSHK